MSKKTLILISCLVLSLTIGLGGSLAYLTDTDTRVNTFTMGKVDIEVEEKFEDESLLKPGQTVEKKAWIENTGDNDAWVWMTVSVPSEIAHVIHLNWCEGVTYYSKVENVEGDNNATYTVYTVLVPEAVPAGERCKTLLDSVTMDPSVDYDVEEGKYYTIVNGVKTEIDYDLSDFEVLVSGYAIQTDGIADINTAYAYYNGQMGDQKLDTEGTSVYAGTEQELLDALTADKQNIVVELTADNLVYDVDAWQNNAMGGASTEKITIIGNGNTLNFKHNNSDWNNVVTNNGATLVLKDIKVTNSDHNDGPWNRHDINFGCDVELINVESDKAMAFKAGAKLTNVTISDANTATAGTYAIWIQPNGQTVTLDGCTIDMLECVSGRGIKIDEQYVDEPAKVTLIVKNTVFKTLKKSAILVKSKAGADINLSNVDISKVAADSTSAVWVDSASAEFFDLVTVTGGTKHQEP